MKDRIKHVRKEKKLSQTEFGKILGVSRDVISNYEMGRVEATDLFINHLCSTFNINEQWLKNGTGEMLVQTKQNILDEFGKAHNLNNTEKAIVEAFVELSPDKRSAVVDYIKKAFGKINDSEIMRNEIISSDISATEKKIQEATAKKEV